MMKNLIFGLTIVAALFTACSNDETVDIAHEKSISFRTLVDHATRANVTTAATLNAFKVTALNSNDVYFTTDVNLSEGNWVSQGTYFWPIYSLKFFAYANGPADATEGVVNIGKAAQGEGFVHKITGFTPKQKVEEQKDLLVAYNEGGKTAFVDGTVPLNFRHALAQIEVNAKNAKPSSVRVEVVGIKLVNLGTKADLTLPTAATADRVVADPAANTDKTLALGTWTGLQGKDTPATAYYKNKAAGTDAVTLTDQFQSIMFGTDRFMVIPQALTPWDGSVSTTGAYLAVLCRISNKSGDNYTVIYPEPKAADNGAVRYAYAAIPIGKDSGKDASLLPGKKYVYNLVFCADGGGGAGKIDPNPNNPGGGTDTDEEPGTGGEDILNGEIKYSVTVDDFVPVDPINVDL